MSAEMIAIPFVRRTSNERVDGTLTVKIDIEPMYKLQFLQMFPNIGAAGALAALIKGAQISETPNKAKVGELCIIACTFCADPEFRRWIEISCNCDEPVSEEDAKKWILETCDIQSRKELDSNSAAASYFHNDIRTPFLAWRDARRAA